VSYFETHDGEDTAFNFNADEGSDLCVVVWQPEQSTVTLSLQLGEKLLTVKVNEIMLKLLNFSKFQLL
jgi:hypothetical protein